MSFTPLTPDAQVLATLGERLRSHRLLADRTQAELAEEAGVSKRTVERLESGRSVQLETLVRVLRALGLIAGLEGLVPAPLPSPLRDQPRQRASGRTVADAPWSWGDEP